MSSLLMAHRREKNWDIWSGKSAQDGRHDYRKQDMKCRYTEKHTVTMKIICLL